jgi:hypothetical protein
MNDQNRFDPGSIGTFRVVDRRFDASSRTLSLGYALDDAVSFTETITFETPPDDGGSADGAGFDRALLHLHMAAGTSYYKAAAPPVILLEHDGLTAAEQRFHHALYDQGLREFALANGLPVPRAVEIEQCSTPVEPPRPTGLCRPGGLLVPIGGGKDSMVLIEAVRDLAPTLFAVNPHPLVLELARQTGLELIVVRRRLSPELAALNRAGALNGHVPITAIVSLIAVVGSFLYGYDTIAMAVERSASEETVVVGGVPVNHQYSKSLEFEQLLQSLIAGAIDPGLSYGSALRPYSELAIARAFAGLTGYHATFCRFAALMSDRDKPFECVGERRESAAAMRVLSGLPRWRETVVVSSLGRTATDMVSEREVTALLTPDSALAFSDPEVASAVDRLLTAIP